MIVQTGDESRYGNIILQKGFAEKMNYQEEKKYIGHKDQLMKVKRFEWKMENGIRCGNGGCSESFGYAF